MRYELISQQLMQFQKDRVLALEHFLEEREIDVLLAAPYKRDLFREHRILHKLGVGTKVCDLVKELTDCSLIRLLFDQKFAKDEVLDFSEINISNLLIACMISLEDYSATFVETKEPIVFSEASYVIVYAKHPPLYLYAEKDFLQNMRKQKGYMYGDRLKIEDFPLIN